LIGDDFCAEPGEPITHRRCMHRLDRGVVHLGVKSVTPL
jgi:hypothetical protein